MVFIRLMLTKKVDKVLHRIYEQIATFGKAGSKNARSGVFLAKMLWYMYISLKIASSAIGAAIRGGYEMELIWCTQYNGRSSICGKRPFRNKSSDNCGNKNERCNV